jgi:hypothetical protein
MHRIQRSLVVMMICASVSTLAAQDTSTLGPIIRSDVRTDPATSSVDPRSSTAPLPVLSDASTPVMYRASDAFAQVVGAPAGPPPTPEHTGIAAMIKGLGHDVTNLPSRENCSGLASAPVSRWRCIRSTLT